MRRLATLHAHGHGHGLGLGLGLGLVVLSGCYSGTSMDDAEGGTDSASGTVGEAGSGTAETGDDGDDDGVPDDLDPDDMPEPLVARLSDTQYAYTILDVLGAELNAEEQGWLPRDVPIEGAYSTSATTQFFNTQYVLGYANIARSLSDRLDMGALLTEHGNCDIVDADCVDTFAASLGLRLYRRPLTDEELTAFGQLASAIGSGEENVTGDITKGLLQAMLQSPQFLYRLEAETGGEPGALRQISGWELASRLSYFLWLSAPDQELLMFAAGPDGDGDFDEDAVEAQVQRMLADPRFDRSRALFWGDYSLASVSGFGTPDDVLAGELRDSLIASFEHISGVDSPAQPLSAVFDGNEIVMTPAVAAIAGADPVGNGLEVYSVHDAEQRLGIVTHPAFIAALGTTSFVGRGRFMTERLLCQHINEPPSDENTANRIMETEMDTANMTPREASEFRFGLEPVCLSCHTQFEPIAYAFERYDPTGRYTLTDDQGRDLFSDGTLPPGLDRPEIEFADAQELLAALAGLEATNACFVENMLEYATGTEAGDPDYFIEAAAPAFESAGHTFDGLVESVAVNPRMSLLRNAAGE